MPETLNHLLSSLRHMMQGADMDHALLLAEHIDADWINDYQHQRIVNSYLFNYIKIQDRMGGKLFRLALKYWREDDNDSLTMLDVLNRLEKLRVIDRVETWDQLREIRNAIAHEYPDDLTTRLETLRLALSSYPKLKEIIANIENALGVHG